MRVKRNHFAPEAEVTEQIVELLSAIGATDRSGLLMVALHTDRRVEHVKVILDSHPFFQVLQPRARAHYDNAVLSFATGILDLASVILFTPDPAAQHRTMVREWTLDRHGLRGRTRAEAFNLWWTAADGSPSPPRLDVAFTDAMSLLVGSRSE